MKRVLLAAIFSAVAFAPAFAFQCPANIAAIDAALAAMPDLTDEQRAEVQELRDHGEELHKAGQHAESVETLAHAKEILGIE